METWETVTMSRKEARRPGLVQLAVAGKITTVAGAHALDMTPRQFRRLKTRYRAEGVRGLVHRLRGRPSPRALEVEVRDRVLELIQTLVEVAGIDPAIDANAANEITPVAAAASEPPNGESSRSVIACGSPAPASRISAIDNVPW